MANEFKIKKGLIVNGSGSTILDIQGSQGQLFSVTDNLSGSLFSVNDISGIPILEVFSNDSINLGTFGNEAIKVSGSNAIITGSLLGTASYATSASQAISASYATVASSSLLATSASHADLLDGLHATSFVLNSQTSSMTVNSASFAINASSSLRAVSASQTVSASYATIASSSLFASTASFAPSYLPLTGGTISGSLIIQSNLTVLGSASIQYISESTLNIGTNLITVNTATPSTRFGGLAVIDSGSSPIVSASFLYDSIQDEFIFVHKGSSTGSITSSVFLLGPETYDNLGNEIYLTANRIPKGTGIEHLNDSNISDNGSIVSINSNTQVTGSLTVTNGITGSLFGTASYATSASQAISSSRAISSSFAVSASFAVSSSFAARASSSLFASVASSSGLATFALSATSAGTATNANNVAVTDTTSGTGPYYLMFADGTTNNRAVLVDSSTLQFNATTNTITVPNLAGTASYATSASQAVSASFATSASRAISASYATVASSSLFATSASRAISASFLTSNTNAFIQGGNSFGSTAVLGTNDNQSLVLETSGSTRMEIDSSGNVGIGTYPNTTLHVEADRSFPSPAQYRAVIYANNISTDLTYSNSIGLYATVATYGGIAVYGNNTSGLGWGGYFEGDGYFSRNVGIGTTTPTSSLDVAGVIRGVYQANPGAGAITAKLLSFAGAPYGLIFRGYDTGQHSIQNQRESNDGEVFALSLQPNGGSVVIGKITSNEKLDVNGNTIITGSLINGTTGSRALGGYSHAEGERTLASGYTSHAEGYFTTSSGQASHAEGVVTTASGVGSHTEGQGTITTGFYSHAEGSGSLASGISSHAEGLYTTSSGDYSHAEGNNTISSGAASHAEGTSTTSTGIGSHAEGYGPQAVGNFSHAEGNYTTSTGLWSHAEGQYADSTGDYSHAEGYDTETLGTHSHTEGYQTKAFGIASHAEGFLTVASGSYQHVQGQYNLSSSAESAFIIGNGTSNANRKNLVFASGSEFQITGSLITSGTLRVGSTLVSGPTYYGATPNAIIGDSTGSVLDLRNTNTNVLGGDTLGIIQFTGLDDTSPGYTSAKIQVTTQDFISSGNNGGSNMRFYTCPPQYGSAIERMHISASGLISISGSLIASGTLRAGAISNVGVTNFGATPNAIIGDSTGSVLDLRNTNISISAGNTLGIIQFSSKADALSAYAAAKIQVTAQTNASAGNNGGSNMKFYTSFGNSGGSQVERMHISASGEIFMSSSLTVTGSLSVGGSSVFSGSVRGFVSASTITSTTASIDLSRGNFFTVALTNGANTHISASNVQPGQTTSIRITQGSLGTGTVTFNNVIDQPSGSFYTASAVNNAVDILTMISFDSSFNYMTYVKNLI